MKDIIGTSRERQMLGGSPLPRSLRMLTVAVLSCLAAACATVPRDFPRTVSSAWDRPGETRLGRELSPLQAGHPVESGFYLLSSGLDAFVARALLAEAAEKTLDVQYCIFHADQSGKILLDRMLAAADRGVRVRLLIDDMYTAGKDRTIAALASHPNFEIRVFNPFAGRSAFSRMFDWFTDFSRVNRRMHNKMFVADGAAGIVGGRNVGDEYFAAREDAKFAGVDLLSIGPVVAELGAVFDAYWNSAFAYPIEAFDRDGYRKYREAMLREGVELYEVRPVPDLPDEARDVAPKRFGSAGASLHAKTLVFDRRTVFIGSANLDPRSTRLNTELGVVATSPDQARQVAAIFEAATDPRYIFRLALRPMPSDPEETGVKPAGEVVWITEEGGKEVVYHDEPYASFWKRLSAGIQSLFAPESLL